MKLNGHDVHLQAVTLRTEKDSREMYDRCRDLIATNNAHAIIAIIREMMRENPDMIEYVDEYGRLNESTIAKDIKSAIDSHADLYEYNKRKHEAAQLKIEDETARQAYQAFEALDVERVEEQVRKDLQARWQFFLKTNQDVARRLYFDTTGFPCTVGALKVGIEVIRATVNRTQTKEDILALIDGAEDTDFWLDVSASEVAQFVDQFLAQM